MDQEKLVTDNVMDQKHRPHNASPSQKTAMPRWRGKGKEKSTIAHACTWVVDHQISTFAETPMCPSPHNANVFAGIAVNLLSIFFLTHVAFPRVRHHTRK